MSGKEETETTMTGEAVPGEEEALVEEARVKDDETSPVTTEEIETETGTETVTEIEIRDTNVKKMTIEDRTDEPTTVTEGTDATTIERTETRATTEEETTTEIIIVDPSKTTPTETVLFYNNGLFRSTGRLGLSKRCSSKPRK